MGLLSKRYLKIEIRTQSSLSIGSGANDRTDHDILVDRGGVPFIPATSVAGVTRHVLNELGLLNTDEDKELFGFVYINTSEKEMTEIAKASRLVFYDVPLKVNNKKMLTTRDQVALDEYKTAKKQHKFDMEVLEKAATGTVLIEENVFSESDKKILDEIAEVWKRGLIRFGAKTTRGFGKVEVTSTALEEFDFSNKEDVKDWLDFDPLTSEYKKIPSAGEVSSNTKKLIIPLELVDGILIRRYTTELPENNEKTAPDFTQMTIHDGAPLIPGTTWAGAFRHHMSKIIPEEYRKEVITKFYGTVEGDPITNTQNRKKANVTFSESILTGSKPKVLTRNAIDRFTGGAADKSLFTEKAYYGGTTKLIIEWKELEDKDLTAQFEKALAACIVDMDLGLLAIGGGTAVGRGLFKVTSIDRQGESMEQKATKLFELILDKERG